MSNVSRVHVTAEERRLALMGYHAVNGAQFGRIVRYILANCDPDGPIAEIYLHRDNERLRRRVRDMIKRDLNR